jgi:hypothetical protein
MQGNLYFSIEEKYQKQIALLQNFCNNDTEYGLVICLDSDEGLDFMTQFFITQGAIIIDIENEIMPNNKICVVQNIDILLKHENKIEHARLLKKIIDESIDKKIIFTIKKDIDSFVLPDLSSRIKSFYHIYV